MACELHYEEAKCRGQSISLPIVRELLSVSNEIVSNNCCDLEAHPSAASSFHQDFSFLFISEASLHHFREKIQTACVRIAVEMYVKVDELTAILANFNLDKKAD